jgi:hypothetical protein
MIIGAMIFWRDRPELLERALLSLRKVADYIVAVDGKFIDYPSTAPSLSSAQTRALVRRYVNQLIDAPDLTQEEKRTQYLIGKPGDQYIILDADEELFVTSSALPLGDYLIPVVYREKTVGLWKIFRYFTHREGMFYKEWHTLLWVDGKPIDAEKLPTHPSIKIIHHSSQRSLERQETDAQFFRNRAKAYRISWSHISKHFKDSGGETMKVKYNGALGEIYHSGKYHIRADEIVDIPIEKAKQILRDFPFAFTVVEEGKTKIERKGAKKIAKKKKSK